MTLSDNISNTPNEYAKLSLQDLEAILAISNATGKDRASCTLACTHIHLAPNKLVITATDGKILAQYTKPQEDRIEGHTIDNIAEYMSYDILLPWQAQKASITRILKAIIKELKAMHKAKKYAEAYAMFHLNDTCVRRLKITTPEQTHELGLVEANYPDTSKIFNKDTINPQAGPVCLNSEYLQIIEKCMMLPKLSKGVAIISQGKGKAVHLRSLYLAGHPVKAVIMPIVHKTIEDLTELL